MTSDAARSEILVKEIVAMAWDMTSFETIKSKTRLSESEIVFLLRTHMQPSSFRRWRTQRREIERVVRQ